MSQIVIDMVCHFWSVVMCVQRMIMDGFGQNPARKLQFLEIGF